MMEPQWSPALPPIAKDQVRNLFTVLWHLAPCSECLDTAVSGKCKTPECSTRMHQSRFSLYMSYYKRLCASYEPLVMTGHPALRTHDDIRRVVEHLKAHPDKTKAEIQKLVFPKPNDPADESNALNLGVSIAMMLNCGSQEYSSILLEDGCNRIVWRQGTTLTHYLQLVLPRREALSPRRQLQQAFLDPSCPLVTAKELKRRAGTRFRGTDDITNHLRYDAINNVLFVFHHATILKEHLRLSSRCGSNPSELTCLKVGALPRQYALEVLHSSQKILFPLWDSESVTLLQSLVDGAGFDSEILNGNDNDFIGDDEEKIDFEYLWPRLSEIYQEIQNPRPRGWLENWLERRSGARYVMLATVAGVAFAVLLGMASLAVSSYQSYLAYEDFHNNNNKRRGWGNA
ncbi:hypothetical protein QBC42DRAFT_266281 [Cladorrhinum samala]|uniref:Uncharacterized protein n=1 Tax=Cladorrhinum samala TaxID=585594 RepID=A0AAV9HT13_9PEZI|nr:hypothetical protein QBC42DRAFT_266281 [Cladorrhinum samala]